MLPEELKQLLYEEYGRIGEEKFYQFLIAYANNRIMRGELQSPTPDMELLILYEKFISLYREEDNTIYLDIAKVCRKAAHKIYRTLLSNNLINSNSKFLTLVY